MINVVFQCMVLGKVKFNDDTIRNILSIPYPHDSDEFSQEVKCLCQEGLLAHYVTLYDDTHFSYGIASVILSFSDYSSEKHVVNTMQTCDEDMRQRGLKRLEYMEKGDV